MSSEYITQLENGAYRIAGTRVSLDSVVYAYRRGELPEGIVVSFPSLTLAQVHGALAFYLDHRAEIDAYLQQNEADFEAMRQAARAKDPAFYEKLARLRQEMSVIKL